MSRYHYSMRKWR